MKSMMFAFAAMLCRISFAGITATWTGAADSYWTNAANWSVDGAEPAKCPGVVSNEVDGVFSPDMPSLDTAVFDGSCGGSRTTIDLSGLYSVKNVIVQGESCPRYVFGTSMDQSLLFETNGLFIVESSVPPASCPVVNAIVGNGNFSADWWNTPSIGRMLTVTNDSSGTLEFNSLFGVQCRRPGSGTGYKEFSLEFGGRGNFRFTRSQPHDALWLPTYFYRHTGTIEVNADFTEQKRVCVEASSRVLIAEGCTYGTFVGNNVGYEVGRGAIFVVEGEGTFRFVENKGTKLDNCGYSKLAGGKMFIYSKVESYASNSSITSPRIILSDSSNDSNGGLRLYGPPGDIPGGVLFRDHPRLTVLSTNSLGNCGAFVATNSTYAAFRWEGSVMNEALTVPIGYLGDESSVFSVWNRGKTSFTVLSEVTAPDAAKTLVLHGESAPIVCALNVRDEVALGLFGDVVLSADAKLQSCPRLELQDCRLVVEGVGPRQLPSLSVLSGENEVAFAGMVELTLSGISVSGGTVDFKVADSGSSVVFKGKTSNDTPPAGLYIDGLAAAFTDEGRLVASPTAIDASIAARGDAVPDSSGSVVGIVRAGEGGADVLAADVTTVEALVQQTDEPAVISIGAVQTLVADEIAVDHAGGPLTVGLEEGVGTLSSASVPLTLRNDSHTAELRVNASVASSDLVKTGAGLAVLAGGMDPVVGSVTFGDGETVISNSTWNTDLDSKVLVTGGAVLALGDGARLMSDQGVAPVDVAVSTVDVSGGLLKVGPGAAITNRIMLNATGSGNVSAVHQTGGSVFAQGNPTHNLYMFGAQSSSSQSYWDISDGTLCLTGRVSVCGDRSLAALRQSGGTVTMRNGMIFRLASGSRCHAEYIMTGGTCAFQNINLRDWGNFIGSSATITIDGPESDFLLLGNLQVTFQNTDSVASIATRGTLNLASGTFCANKVIRGANENITVERSRTKGFVNFNGGTFKTRVDVGSDQNISDGLFGGVPEATVKSWIDYVTVYSGGATIETDAKTRRVYVRTPFRKPEGKGVASISILRSRTGLIAPPHVIIEGDGMGASAYAEFDRESGTVTGIRVVSPGWGYTTVSARLAYGSFTDGIQDDCEVRLAEVQSGGLTKTGPGTLVLAAASTYTGATVLKGGTLELSTEGAVPSASVIAYEGGALASKAAAFPESLKVRIPGAESGSVLRCTLATFTDSCPAVPPEVEVVNAPEAERSAWRTEFAGNTLRAVRTRGTALIIR